MEVEPTLGGRTHFKRSNPLYMEVEPTLYGGGTHFLEVEPTFIWRSNPLFGGQTHLYMEVEPSYKSGFDLNNGRIRPFDRGRFTTWAAN